MNERWKQKKKSSKKGKAAPEDESKRDDALSARSTPKRERSTPKRERSTQANAELQIGAKANAELQINALDPKQKRSNYRQILHKVH